VKCLVIVPAYNEGKNIYNVVTSIRISCPKIDVVVINDGSKDNTQQEALRAGAKVIDLSHNLGIGGAVQTGYIYALYKGYDVAIQIDGDGQHDPRDLIKLIDVLEEEQVDMVIGSRFVGKSNYKPNIFRKLGITYFSLLVSYLCRKSYRDTTSGYRVANKRVIRLFAEYYPTDYPEVETIVLANKQKLKVKEVLVDMKDRQGGKSSITPLRSIYYMFKVTLALLLIPERKEAAM
jgi:glycosyltransferase involved in cell wall biosynthesis